MTCRIKISMGTRSLEGAKRGWEKGKTKMGLTRKKKVRLTKKRAQKKWVSVKSVRKNGEGDQAASKAASKAIKQLVK
jgi:hypothetical protein